MALTHEDSRALNALFPFQQHEFTRGFVYIQEQAICDRLDQVDPSWCFDLKSVQVRDSDVVVVGTLTLKGVVREGVGMAKIMDKGAEAEKSAATDALKRAARLFGVGRYLLGAPEEKQFAAWLAKLNGNGTPARAATGNPNTSAVTIDLTDTPNRAHTGNYAPPANGWSTQQYDDLLLIAEREGVDKRELPGLLGVARVSEYTPGFDKAAELVKARGAAIKANGGAK